jgi:hypothetical protein
VQQPSDDAVVPPPADAEPAAPASGQIDGAAALAGTPDLDADLSLDTTTEADTPAPAIPTADRRVPLAAIGDYADALNLAERVVAELGAWASTLAERWTPALGPFFASDGRTAVDSCEILSTLDSELGTTVC